MSNLSSREKATEIINFESSTSEIDSLVLNNLTSAIYSPIINFYSSTINIKQSYIRKFDKTLFYLESGKYTFSKLNVTEGKIFWAEGKF